MVRRSFAQSPWTIFLIAVLFLASSCFRQAEPTANPAPVGNTAPLLEDRDRVVRVVDGDTVILEGLGRARLAGIDAPESVRPNYPVEPFGKEAFRYLKARLAGESVTVEWDAERKDRYERWLVYIRLDDGSFVNAEMIERGMAITYSFEKMRYTSEFLKLEAQARAAGVGLWSGKRHAPYHGNTRSGTYHSEVCEYYECENCSRVLESRLEAEEAGYRPHWACVRGN